MVNLNLKNAQKPGTSRCASGYGHGGGDALVFAVMRARRRCTFHDMEKGVDAAPAPASLRPCSFSFFSVQFSKIAAASVGRAFIFSKKPV